MNKIIKKEMNKFSKKIILATIAILSVFGLVGPITTLAAGPAAVVLGTAGNFVILGETAITDANPTLTSVTGNVGLSGAAGSNITGISCTEIAGSIYDVDGTYTGGHDSNISCLLAGPGANKTLVDNAVLDMGTAYVDGNTRPAATGAELNIGTGTLNGQNFVPGLYTWTTNVNITGDITLTGGATDVWIFQVTGTLDLATNKQIILAGGALNTNVFWIVTGATTLFPSSVFRGNILDQTSIAMQAGAVLNGRALAQAAVTLIGNTISTSNPVAVAPVVHRRSVRYGKINVIKIVINDNGGTKTVNDFSLFVSGSQVMSGATNTFRVSSYLISETLDPNYKQIFSGDCDIDGMLNLGINEEKICTITNNDIAAVVPVVAVATSTHVVVTPFATTTINYVSPTNLTTEWVRIFSLAGLSSTTTIDFTPTPVTVVTPSFPNTGIFPETGNIALNIVIAVIIVSLISTLLIWILKRVRVAAGISRTHVE